MCQSAGQAVDRRVLAHRRHHDAVGERHVAQPERLEHRRRRLGSVDLEALRLRVARHHLVGELDELRRAQRQVVVGDRLRARHQPEGEARRVHVPEPLDVLEPDERHVGGMLGLLDLLAPRRFEARERGLDVASAGEAERLVERDGILHRELGARADGEMRGRLGVADQHDVVGGPLLAADGREVAPQRAVGDQLVAGELLGEHAFEESRRCRLVELVEAGALEGLGIGLHHPGRAAGLVLIAMRDEDAVRRFPEEEVEGVHRPVRAHPAEVIRAELDGRLELVLERLAGARVDAVGGDHEIGAAGRGLLRVGLRAVFEVDAERVRAPAENFQQHRARGAAEAVAADADASCRGNGSRCRPNRRSGRRSAGRFRGRRIRTPASVWSENTTPKPNVSSGLLRSNTVMRVCGHAFFIRMAK